MTLIKPTVGQANWGATLNTTLDAIDERLVSLETVVDEVVPLPTFLTYAEDRAHLPALNTNFGWDSSGAWFGSAQDGSASYPIFTNFTIPTNYKVQVEFDIEIDSFCSDAGMCFYVNGTTPEWSYQPNATRIAAQFDCPSMQIQGIEGTSEQSGGTEDTGVFRAVVVYDPADTENNVIFRLLTTGDTPTLVSEVTLTETLPTGAYRIGFAADMTDTSPDSRTYISNLSISINNGATLYEDSLQEGSSGTTQGLVAPVSVKDSDGANLITFEKSYTGTARIFAPQDDLALRSARDILLYAGDDGPGKVYVGWGDDSMNAFPGNEVATKGYVEEVIGSADGLSLPYGTSNARTGSGDVLRFAQSTNQSIITGAAPSFASPTAQRLVIAGQDGTAGDGYDGEGGDVYVWAGQGGGTNGDGGDVKIDGGQGQGTGQGGYVKVRGGYSENSTGGFVDIYAGDSSMGSGGNISIAAGTNQSVSEAVGGTVSIYGGGSADANSGGNILLETYQNGKVTLSGAGGEFLNDSSNSANQIATVGDVAAVTSSGATGSFTSADGKTVTVTNGIITSIA